MQKKRHRIKGRDRERSEEEKEEEPEKDKNREEGRAELKEAFSAHETSHDGHVARPDLGSARS